MVQLLIPCFVTCAILAADPTTPEPDPWNGKARAEVVKLLGEPDKAKTTRDGRETLTYAFDRIAPDALLHPEVMVLHVPGIGVVARIDRRAPTTLELEPPEYDEAGRAVGGGLTQTTKASTSYDPQTGEVTQSSAPPDRPRATGKVKLRFAITPDGVVDSWSVSGKE